MRGDVWNLRARRCFSVLERAFLAASKESFQIVHYAVMGNRPPGKTYFENRSFNRDHNPVDACPCPLSFAGVDSDVPPPPTPPPRDAASVTVTIGRCNTDGSDG